jgi:ribonuclease HI
MTDPKPTAAQIKKSVLATHTILPEGLEPTRLFTHLANPDAVVRMLAADQPGATEADIRRWLASTATPTRDLEAWAAPTPSKPAREKDASPLSSGSHADFSDPAAIREHQRVKVYVDGASKGNPGPASAGIVISDIEGVTLYEEGKYLGVMTNNAAEYGGLIQALTVLVDNGCPEAYFFADSMLVVKQMNMEWRVKHPDMKPLFTRAQQLKRRLPRFQIVHVTRDKNDRADALANLAIKQARAAQLI